ncbi:MAG: DUF4186 domain-containing protein [Sedimentisphaerales bacterium]|nr:DUF4186 domain-containing protein [Sedimentisphaerales bacterium]
MRDLDELFEGLLRSKFRSRFKLKPADIEYIGKRGMAAIERHARDFVTDRLAASEPKNDGKQTPMRGHPVFIAQHATATCCRKCLQKWHGIARDKSLSSSEIDYTVSVLIGWINNQIDNPRPIV